MSRAPFLILCAGALISVTAHAGDPSNRYYSAKTIPPALLAGADAIVRYDAIRLEVSDEHSARETGRRIVTILREAGRSFAGLAVDCDAFHKLKELDGKIFDSTGHEIRSLREWEKGVHYREDDKTFQTDEHSSYARFTPDSYPCTVEFEYTREFDGYVEWPDWEPQAREAPVEYSVYDLDIPKEMTFRTSATFDITPLRMTIGDRLNLRWESRNLPPFEKEKFGPAEADQAKRLLLSPSAFRIENRRGEFTSWRSFGRWYGELQENRQTLSAADSAAVRRLTEDVPDARAKARRLYQYMQGRTRYLSITLGIGGWQPLDAAYVGQHGYGDCKALSNYMRALLAAAGVPSFPVLINSASPAERFDTSFVGQVFNHVILAVPTGSDTIWLECTDQMNPFGHLSPTTENRYALLIRPDGGELVKTPASAASDNVRGRSGRVTLTVPGSSHASLIWRFTGGWHDYAREKLGTAGPDDRKSYVGENLNLPGERVVSTTFSGMQREDTALTFTAEIELQGFAAKGGNRVLFSPFLPQALRMEVRQDSARKSPVVFPMPFISVDSLTFIFPDGYAVESLPGQIALSTDVAAFRASVVPAGEHAVLAVTRWECGRAELPAARFNEYTAFIKAVAAAEKSMVSLIRK